MKAASIVGLVTHLAGYGLLGSGLDRSIPVLANPDLLQSDLCDEHWCNGFALLHPFAFRAHATGFQGI